MAAPRRVGFGLLALVAAGCELPPRFAGAPGGVAPDTGAAGAAGDCTAALDGGAGAPDGGACARSQSVLTCDVTNARDLGGVPLGATGSVACGVLLRGPPLADLSAAGCDAVARLGLRTVIDLRTDGERMFTPDDACVGARVVAAPLPVPYDVSPSNYLADFETMASIVKVFETLGDAAAYPIYFHCTYGRDRTGI